MKINRATVLNYYISVLKGKIEIAIA